jgi:23S rRNA pseudouridine955/2504/2580 synthase
MGNSILRKRMLELSDFIAQEDDDERRLDRIVRKMLRSRPLGEIYRLIRTGGVRLNGRKAKPSSRVRKGDRISLLQPSDSGTKPRRPSRRDTARRDTARRDTARYDHDRRDPVIAHRKPLSPLILFEDAHILAVNKPAGWLVHGGGSLEEAVRDYLSGSSSRSLSFRPGPVHRLDRNTSGILLFSKTLAGARLFSRLFREGRVEKCYVALLDGSLTEREVWIDKLVRDRRKRTTGRGDDGGKLAEMAVLPVVADERLTLCTALLRGGKTHQIRTQASLHHHPLAGDRKYGGSSLLSTYMLHAAGMRVHIDSLDLGPASLTAPLPGATESMFATLFGESGVQRVYEIVREFVADRKPSASSPCI